MTNADHLRIASEVSEFTESHESASRQLLVQKYLSIIREVTSEMDEGWMQTFRQCRTDFQRVCFLLRALHTSTRGEKHGIEKLGLPTTKEEISQTNGKSDAISETYLAHKESALGADNIDLSLFASTMAVFYAASPEQKSRALAHRCFLMKYLQLIDAAIEEGESALKLPCPQSLIEIVHLQLAECYLVKNMSTEAIFHLLQTISYLNHDHTMENLEYASITLQGTAKFIPRKGNRPTWKCFRPEAPTVTQIKKVKKSDQRNNGNSSETDERGGSNKAECQLLASPNGVLRLKYTGPMSGWTMELTEAVFTGDVLAVERPWAIGLWEKRTMYCYFCCKRCHNLIPCSGCPYVGFCSDACAQSAMKQDEPSENGNFHIYDCHGLLPLICLNTVGEYSYDPENMNAAFKCIARVLPKRLLDYVCSTGPYEGGKGHQAFVGAEKIRDIPPTIFDPSDYSAVAWLFANSDNLSNIELWRFTVAAIFLTYCLHLGGYQMDWFEETDESMCIFFSDPSPSNRPNRIPASWVAACMLYHIQSADCNTYMLSEIMTDTGVVPLPFSSPIASCIYPTISLINHSCNPSIAFEFANRGTAFLYALQSLPAGSEISISYGSTFPLLPMDKRRLVLKTNYHFHCECEACSNKWDEQLGKLEVIRCPDCSSFYPKSDRSCHGCKSTRGIQLFNSLVHVIIPRLKQRLCEGTWTTEDLKVAAENIDLAQSILSLPSKTLLILQDIHSILTGYIHGNRTIEPWSRI